MKTKLLKALCALIATSLLAACGASASSSDGNTKKLILGAYTTPREAYGELIPMFAAQWKEKNGQEVTFEESYLGSGAQARAIAEGFEADIAALSLDGDIKKIADAGLITHDWHTPPYNGMVSTSIVAFAVRKGNPKNIHDWADLAQPGLEILTPDPKTSGGAQWNILALYGAALRGQVKGVAANDETAATEFLKSVLKNVTVFDKGARESITNFEAGTGDVAITYENEVLVGKQSGQDYELVIPTSTILIENPVAVVDTYVDKHGTRAAAEAFIQFLFTKEAQQVFAKHGLRSVDPEVAAATQAQYPAVTDLFTIGDQFGGWSKATPKYFSDTGIYTQAIVEVQGQ
ncbi:MAG TPA: sulfate ABC transporter substrate-binding protein [Anaerolineales bacterium]|nr:sulfate ABC transporter substrate-binding protein [Anaerolineales bacterium]